MRDTHVSGLFASVRQVACTALEMVQVRLALLGTELELEKQRLFEGLLMAVAALLSIGLGLLLLCGFIVMLFWEGYRLAAMASLSALFIGLGAVLFYQSRKRFKNPSGLFHASVTELHNDCAHLRPTDRRA
jgi:uncharacterized membrane protein YqjE